MSADPDDVTYAELLRLAVGDGLQELDCTIVQVPNNDNGQHAIVLASVRTTRALFRAIGEARGQQLPTTLRDQALSVAESRAKKRALSDALGKPVALVPGTASTATPSAAAATEIQAQSAASSPTPSPIPAVPPAGAAIPPGSARVAQTDTSSSLPDVRIVAETPASAPARSTHADAATLVRATMSAAPAHATDQPGIAEPADEASPASAMAAERSRPQATRQPARPVVQPPAEGLGPDILARLLQMTRRKAAMEGTDIGEEEAMQRLDSFFQRKFGHALVEGTRMEGQRVVQRLASDLSRLSAESDGIASAG